MTDDNQALYVREGERFVPTGLGVSTWNPKAQGGAPVAALVGHLLSAIPSDIPMLPVRLTIDILGVVPMTALEPRIRATREGKRIQVWEIELVAAGRSVVRASMLRARIEGEGQDIVPLSHPFPEHAEPLRRTMAETIFLDGDPETLGHNALWMRVIRPIVAGEPLVPLACVALAGDWGTTVSPPAALDEWTFANLDISLHLSRLPRSDWMLLDGASEVAGNGTGVAHIRMGDRLGMFGSAHQSVYLDRRANT